MTMSHADVDKLLVLVDVDDPALADADFLGAVHYGGFIKECPQFTEENIAKAKQIPSASYMHGKFAMEIYTDRFIDFVYTVLPHPEWQRALIFRQALAFIPDADDLPDDLPEEALEEFVQRHLIYEMRSMSKVPTQRTVGLDSDADTVLGMDEESDDEVPAYLH
jgi:hypothetical protein